MGTRVLITRSWSELELRGLDSALAMLAEARARAEWIGDPLLVALTFIQEGTLHGRGRRLAGLPRGPRTGGQR